MTLAERFQEQAQRQEAIKAMAITENSRQIAEGQIAAYEVWGVMVEVIDNPREVINEHIVNVKIALSNSPAYYSGKLAALNAIKFLITKE